MVYFNSKNVLAYLICYCLVTFGRWLGCCVENSLVTYYFYFIFFLKMSVEEKNDWVSSGYPPLTEIEEQRELDLSMNHIDLVLDHMSDHYDGPPQLFSSKLEMCKRQLLTRFVWPKYVSSQPADFSPTANMFHEKIQGWADTFEAVSSRKELATIPLRDFFDTELADFTNVLIPGLYLLGKQLELEGKDVEKLLRMREFKRLLT